MNSKDIPIRPNLKITKIKPWRINFRLNGVLYSLNEDDAGEYDRVLVLRNLDEREIIHSLDFEICDVFNAVHKQNWKPGITFGEFIDKDTFGLFIDEMMQHRERFNTIVGIVRLQKYIECDSRDVSRIQERIKRNQGLIEKYYDRFN